MQVSIPTKFTGRTAKSNVAASFEKFEINRLMREKSKLPSGTFPTIDDYESTIQSE